MSNFRIVIDVKEVTEEDTKTIAQEIWDRYADELDARLGDFQVGLRRVSETGAQFGIDWEPV